MCEAGKGRKGYVWQERAGKDTCGRNGQERMCEAGKGFGFGVVVCLDLETGSGFRFQLLCFVIDSNGINDCTSQWCIG